MSKILIIGDIMGRPGRLALRQVLPIWKEELGWDEKSDVLVGNVENLAHGKGVTLQTLAEIDELGFDAFTSGNHVFDTGPNSTDCFNKYDKLIRPSNYIGDYDGVGYHRFAKNGQQYLVLNLSGRLFMEMGGKWEIANPFFALDDLIQQQSQKDDIIIVDLHAEATSETQALGWHADGRITVLYGTHTHVPTADERLLHKGTAFISDVGFSGAYDSVLGVSIDVALDPYLERGKFRPGFPESGPAAVNALLVETEGNKAVKVQRLQKIVHFES